MEKKQKRYLNDIRRNEDSEDRRMREVQEDISQALYKFNTGMDQILREQNEAFKKFRG